MQDWLVGTDAGGLVGTYAGGFVLVGTYCMLAGWLVGTYGGGGLTWGDRRGGAERNRT